MNVEAIGASAAGGEGTPGVIGAGERVQRLQALIAQVEDGPAGFAAALDAAQSTTGGTAPATGAGASDTLTPGTGAVPASSYSTVAAGLGSGDAVPTVEALPTAEATTAAGATTATGAIDAATPVAGAAYSGAIQEAATRNGVEPALLYGLIEQESGFDPSATSSAGAQGLTQLMPSTAASLGVSEPLNPTQSIEGGAHLLGELLRQFGGDTGDALAAYNAGAGAVEQYGGIPPYPETEQYVSKVLANAEAYRQSTGATAGIVPTTTAVAPATTGYVPTTTADTPATTGYVPATTADTPATTADTPATTAAMYATAGGTRA